jgi:hypothetical protein
MPDVSIGSHLIRPRPEWIDWDDYAEREIDHISREMLAVEGKDPTQVAAVWRCYLREGRLLECFGRHIGWRQPNEHGGYGHTPR